MKNIARRKSTATVSAVRPVRPPCSTPLALSTKVVTVEVPSTAPAVVPIASDMSAWLALGRRPFSSSMLARLETPTSVPTVSKKSTKKKASVTLQKAGCASIEKSIFMNIGESDGGMETIPSGIFATPSGIASAVTTTTPMRMPPFTRRASSVTMSSRPRMESSAGTLPLSLPRPRRTAGLSTMMPEPWRPMKVMKSPMPAETPILSVLGIELTTSSRTLVQVSTMKITPSTKTAASATCHGMPMPRTTVKAKKALSPMPGASANG